MTRMLTLLLGLILAVSAYAHLCNDVFVQAKDNLAVKVDIRDGQLRVDKEASFRVYLLNTMDRDIVSINLEAVSPQFQADVKPSPDWQRYPYLKAVKSGGKKEYFTVTLARNPGVPDGKYKIELRLFNGQKRDQTFKTVDLEGAADLIPLPQAKGVVVDGNASEQEWMNSALCANFYCYAKAKQYLENQPAAAQTRVRMNCDKDYVYFLASFQGGEGATADEVTFYVAPDSASQPVTLTCDRISGAVTCDKGSDGIVVKTSAAKDTVECKVPRALLGIQNVPAFNANFTRTTTQGEGKVVSYWRGNSFSVKDPIVYGQFKPAL